MKYREQIFKDLEKTDTEFVGVFTNFATNEVINEENIKLDDKTRLLTSLAVLLGSGAKKLYEKFLPLALKKLTPSEVKEVLYQSVAYLGLGRIYEYFEITNKVINNLNLSLPEQKEIDNDFQERLKKGEQSQIDIFGKSMRDYANKGTKGAEHINRWLVSNCFGDYYTRGVLNNKERELITFCYIYAQGGCEAQLKGHTLGNISVGNTKELLIAIVSNNVPYIGYPRSLNALAVINETIK